MQSKHLQDLNHAPEGCIDFPCQVCSVASTKHPRSIVEPPPAVCTRAPPPSPILAPPSWATRPPSPSSRHQTPSPRRPRRDGGREASGGRCCRACRALRPAAASPPVYRAAPSRARKGCCTSLPPPPPDTAQRWRPSHGRRRRERLFQPPRRPNRRAPSRRTASRKTGLRDHYRSHSRIRDHRRHSTGCRAWSSKLGVVRALVSRGPTR